MFRRISHEKVDRIYSFAHGAGCFALRVRHGGKPAATNAPRPSGTPMTATPDMNDGIVNDDDGIITDDDTGVVPTQTPMADTSAKPSASAQATDGVAKK